MSSTWDSKDSESWNNVIDDLILHNKHDVPDPTGKTPLWHAANYGYTEFVQKLCAARVDVDRQDRFGRTALFRAAAEGHTETVEVLLKYDANPDVWKRNNLSPIYEAIAKRHTEIIKLLLSRQPKIELPLSGISSIWSAVQGDQQIKDLLAQYGVTEELS